MYKNRYDDNHTKRNNICGRKVAQLRIEKGWSQRELAEKLQTIGHDVGKNQISQLELGRRFVNDIELKALSEIFHVSVNELLNEDIYMIQKNVFAYVADNCDTFE